MLAVARSLALSTASTVPRRLQVRSVSRAGHHDQRVMPANTAVVGHFPDLLGAPRAGAYGSEPVAVSCRARIPALSRRQARRSARAARGQTAIGGAGPDGPVLRRARTGSGPARWAS